MRVISNNGAEYTVHDLVRNQNIPVHVSRLKRFELDKSRVDPLHIAAKDNEENEVGAIKAHSGDPKGKNTMETFNFHGASFGSTRNFINT
jgi:hypothetical protein